MKTCTKCGAEKERAEFSLRSDGSGNLRSACKTCACAYAKERYPENSEKCRQNSRGYYQKNVGEIKEKKRNRRRDNPEQVKSEDRAHSKRRYKKDREKVLGENKRWRTAHKKEINKRLNIRYHEDPNFKLIVSLRSRLGNAIRRAGAGQKSAPTMELTGCTVAELWAHFESLFHPGMTKENWGPVWHVDHKRPLASFDLTDPEQQKACFHWTNLQPLFAAENLKKSDTYYAPPACETRMVE